MSQRYLAHDNGWDDKLVAQYLSGFVERSQTMAANLDTRVDAYSVEENLTIPLTINEAEYSNSYVCSPYTALVPYSLEELNKVDNRLLRYLCEKMIRLVDRFIRRCHINRVVHVNNWMLSTNLYPDVFQRVDANALLDTLCARYDQHALIFRSLNGALNESLLKSLSAAGCLLVPTRQVYLYHKKIKDYSLTHNYSVDKRLLARTSYRYVAQSEITAADYTRIVELYSMLYLDKYSRHNPQFTEKFIAQIIQHPLFYLEGFRNADGVLDAVGGRFTLDGTTTLPIVGYDTGKPRNLGLYRLVLISTLLHAEKNNLTFNASSGAPGFKRLRGGVPFIEYSAIYVKHLPLRVRLVWGLLAKLLRMILVPMMRRYRL